MKDRRIGVVYLTDGNRDDLTYASIVALGLNHIREIDIHVVQAGFHCGPPPAVLAFLQARGHRLAMHSIAAAEGELRVDRPHISATTYVKAEAIAAVADDHDFVCYVDNDTLAVRPLDLALAAPKRQAFAAAPDLSVSTGFDNPDFFTNCDNHGLERRYFNAGLLAINVSRWKNSGIVEEYKSAVQSHARFCPYWSGSCTDLDQCALNIAAQGAWEMLPVRFNVQKSAFQTRFWDEAWIRHYTGHAKFLPARAHRVDRHERSILGRVARACPELGIEIPAGYLGFAYWVNGLRRRTQRTSISRLIDQHIAFEIGHTARCQCEGKD